MTQIDLSRLPPPDVVEAIDYEQLVADITAHLVARAPELSEALGIESEPATKLVQAFAYREMLLRQRINDGARAVMLASAAGADLDQLAALYGVARFVLDPGDADAVPPVPPTMETDADFRARVQLAPESWTSAGSRGAYLFHTLSADADVKDAGVRSPLPGDVEVTVLSRTGDGTADATLLTMVTAALNDEEVRPLTDNVSVQSATISTYTIEATLTFYPGPDAATALAEAQAAATAYADAQHRIGRDVTRSGIFAALHRPGVHNVDLTAPAADIVIDEVTAALCTGITLTNGGVDE